MAKGPGAKTTGAAAAAAKKASGKKPVLKGDKLKGGKALTIVEQVRQRLRETFRDLPTDEQNLKTAGEPPRTLAQQLHHDLDQAALGIPVQFGKFYNDKMRDTYKIKSAQMQALSYSPPPKPAAVQKEGEGEASQSSTDLTCSVDQQTDVTPGLLRAPLFVFVLVCVFDNA